MPLLPSQFEEVADETQRFNFGREDTSAVRVVRIYDWLNVPVFMEELFPLVLNAYTIGTARFNATFPHLLAHTAMVQPWDSRNVPDGTGFCSFTNGAKVTINYKSQRYDRHQESGPNNDRTGPGGKDGSTGNGDATFVSHSGQSSFKQLEFPGLTFRFAKNKLGNTLLGPLFDGDTDGANNDKLPELVIDEKTPVNTIIPVVSHEITWNFVQWPPWDALLGRSRYCFPGCVNRDPIAGAPPQTMLYTGCTFHRDIAPKAQPVWKLVLKMEELNNNRGLNRQVDPWGWNHFPRRNRTKPGFAVLFDLVVQKGRLWDDQQLIPVDADAYPYPLGDFKKLFTENTPQ